MNVFQIVVLCCLFCLFLGTSVAFASGHVRRGVYFVWSLLWIVAAVATVWPDLTSSIARRVGIGRGADLVSYSAIVAMLIGFWMVYVRLQRQGRELTLLVRRLAQVEAKDHLNRRGDLS